MSTISGLYVITCHHRRARRDNECVRFRKNYKRTGVLCLTFAFGLKLHRRLTERIDLVPNTGHSAVLCLEDVESRRRSQRSRIRANLNSTITINKRLLFRARAKIREGSALTHRARSFDNCLSQCCHPRGITRACQTQEDREKEERKKRRQTKKGKIREER